MLNKFEKTYARIIAEMSNKKSKKKLLKEQVEGGCYNLTLVVQDSWPYSDEGMDSLDNEEEYSRTAEDCDFDAFFKKFGGVCVGGPAEYTRNGEFEYKYEFKGLTKEQLFELMTTDYNDTGMPIIEVEANNNSSYDDQEFINNAKSSPDACLEAVKKLYEDASDTGGIFEFSEC